jgi:Tol biopolymer transport system component
VKPPWIHATWRVNIDGTGPEELPVPAEDGVQDWSPDGRWLLTASERGAKNGYWQLYIMRTDGTEERRITEEGNPFYARFSPGGRRVLYSDNGRGERAGIWVVDADGENARLVFRVDPAKTTASACWSPDGRRIAILLAVINGSATRVPTPVQVVAMDLDGGHRSEIQIPEAGMTDMPDWR